MSKYKTKILKRHNSYMRQFGPHIQQKTFLS